MFSKKEDFLFEIQHKIGFRLTDEEIKELNSINKIVQYLVEKNNRVHWKFLNFIPFYFQLKKNLEKITQKEIKPESNLNDLLNKEKKNEFLQSLNDLKIKPIAFKRPKAIHNFVFVFPLLSILFPMLISTYLIVSKEYSGWIYLSGFIGLILSVLLFKLTEKLKNQFHPATFIYYVKSTYVIRYKILSQNEINQDELALFLKDELTKVFKRDFGLDEIIPI